MVIMSRSRRKTPIRGITTAASDKSSKIASHRRIRRTIRQLALENLVVLPEERQITNSWSFNKDGKKWFDSDQHPDLMRK
jgi:hypothetical protein